MEISREEKIALIARCRASLPFFGERCLRLREKGGTIVPLALNAAQQLVHERLERQLSEKGWVRALILKGRQQGMSTFTAGRFYHRATLNSGTNVYILAHEQAASDNLFDIVERYQRHNPLAPHVSTANVKELVFDRLDSSYTVATAGQKGGGRSRTISLFHGSEVAFWPNAPAHFASSVQAVPLLPGTEIILESTANGPGGEFYERWQDAEAGRGDYIAVFVPWFLSPEYSRVPDEGFTLSDEAPDDEMSEVEYAETYGLSLAQMAWRRSKIAELRSEALFRQEYPATPHEAFVSTDHKPFISALHVLRARKRKRDAIGPLIIGVDPASLGGDRFSVAHRRGLCVTKVEWRAKIDEIEGAAWIASIIDEHDPARVNIDAGGIGHAIITMLRNKDRRYSRVIRAINFGGTSEHKLAKPKMPGPVNRRAEMWARLRDALKAEEGFSLPDIDALQSDITGPRLKPKGITNDFLLESKQDMRARGVRSPDLADSVVLTFASNEHFSKYTEGVSTPRFGDLDVTATRQRETEVLQSHVDGPFGWLGV